MITRDDIEAALSALLGRPVTIEEALLTTFAVLDDLVDRSDGVACDT